MYDLSLEINMPSSVLSLGLAAKLLTPPLIVYDLSLEINMPSSVLSLGLAAKL